MKKLIVLMVVLAMALSFASFTFAEDDINVDVSNESTNNVNVNAQQDQNQNQWQGQNQNACATVGDTTANGGAGGNATGGNADSNSSANSSSVSAGGAGGNGYSEAIANPTLIANPTADASVVANPIITTSSGGGKSDANANVIDSGNSNSEVNNSGNADVKISGVEGGKSSADADSSAEIGDTTAKSETTVKGVEGDVTNQNIYISPENKRSHIGAPTGPSGNFLGTPGFIASKDWQMFVCQPLFKFFTPEEMEEMSKGAGGWFSSGIQKSLRIKKVDDYDQLPIVRLDFVPGEIADRILGDYEYTAENPMPLSQALAHVLFQAKKDTNTHRVVVWIKERGEVQNSGLSIGSGVAGSRLWGPDGDATAGAIGLGGLIGTTTARTQEIYGIRVWALNDGSTDPPEGVEVCGLKVSAPAPEKADFVEEEIPPQKIACDPQPIITRIGQLEEGTKNCPNDCLNNELLRKQLGDAYLDLFYCVGNTDALAKAIAEYKKAENNFLEGFEPNGTRTSTLQGAKEILYKAHYNSALAILELSGIDSEIAFAWQKKLGERGDGTMPENQNDIKR